MGVENINQVTITGNLTHDPELRALPSGTSICKLRVAVNERYKNGATGEWTERANYFDVVVWAGQGEACARYLAKGRPVAVAGKLRWDSWQDKESGKNRSKVEIIADRVQFLGGRDDGGGGFTPRSDVPADTGDFGTPTATPAAASGSGGFGVPAGAPVSSPADDDIPFKWEGPCAYSERREHTSRW